MKGWRGKIACCDAEVRTLRRAGNFICVKSDNNFYEPLKMPFLEIKEIWEFACSINTEEFDAEEFSGQNIKGLFLELKQEIKKIDHKLSR